MCAWSSVPPSTFVGCACLGALLSGEATGGAGPSNSSADGAGDKLSNIGCGCDGMTIGMTGTGIGIGDVGMAEIRTTEAVLRQLGVRYPPLFCFGSQF